MKRNVSVVCVSVVRLVVATRSSGPPASGKIIKEMPGSVASGTPCIRLLKSFKVLSAFRNCLYFITNKGVSLLCLLGLFYNFVAACHTFLEPNIVLFCKWFPTFVTLLLVPGTD